MITINKYRVNKLIPDAANIIKAHTFYKEDKKTNPYFNCVNDRNHGISH